MIVHLSMIVVIVFIVMLLSQKCCESPSKDENGTGFYERSSTYWIAALSMTLLLLFYLLIWIIPSPMALDLQ